jgi:hypothetical protein
MLMSLLMSTKINTLSTHNKIFRRQHTKLFGGTNRRDFVLPDRAMKENQVGKEQGCDIPLAPLTSGVGAGMDGTGRFPKETS